jgi:tRNA pseudouridine13 synthase
MTPQMQQELAAPPRLCADLPGTGGSLKDEPEDFVVTELPAYEPSGAGEHLFLWLRKRDMPAFALSAHIARTLQVPPAEIGCAGLKDARAVTTQYLSVPKRCEAHLEALGTDPRVELLGAKLHGNKLKTGHLRGNAFAITVRDVVPDALARAQAIVQRLTERGVPNFFGAQRFGRDGRTVADGLALLGLSDRPAPRLGRGPRRLALSALQSLVFNACLRARMQDGLLHTVLAGDVCQVRASGGPFVAEDAAVEQARLIAGEIVVAGPIWGPKMRATAGEAQLREAAALQRLGLRGESFAGDRLMQGTRRPYLVWPAGLRIEAAEGGGITAHFELPSGAYATGVMAELMGPPAA